MIGRPPHYANYVGNTEVWGIFEQVMGFCDPIAIYVSRLAKIFNYNSSFNIWAFFNMKTCKVSIPVKRQSINEIYL